MDATTPEERSREIARLWARVSAATPAASSAEEIPATFPVESAAGAELAWDTVALMKRQQRQREETWERAVAARDEAARVLRERLAAAEEELARLRDSRSQDEERMIVETLDARERVEAAQKAMLDAQQRHDEERAILEDALRGLRERLSAEAARARADAQRWSERDLQRDEEVRELRLLAERRKEESSVAELQAGKARESVMQAKEALERTLAELLLERRSRAESEREREAAQKRVDELQAHVEGLQKIWEEEREQWNALWNRERSSWEDRRAELARWEETVRREREEWRAEREAERTPNVSRIDDRPPAPPPPPAPTSASAPKPRWRRVVKVLFPFADF